MNVKHLVFLVVVEVWSSLVLIHTYTIERRVVYQSRTWSDMPDSFMIPSSICSSGRSSQSIQCSKMGANYDNNNCKCICETSKSTFGFYEDKWKCFENTKVHLHGGNCSIELNYRHTSGVLRVLPMRNPAEYYFFLIPDTDCGLINDYSYLMCDGTWAHLGANLFSSRFNINHFSGSFWYLKYSTGLLSTSAINGHLFRFQFECGPVDQPTTLCALFKVTGTLKCPPSPTPSSSMMFSTRRVLSSTVTVTLSSSSAPASSLFLSPSSTPRLKTSVPLPTPSLSSNKFEYSSKSTTIPSVVHTLAATATEKPTSGNDAKTNISETTTAVVNRREENARSDDDDSGVIAGALAGVSGLVIIVVAMIVVMRRRKRRDTEPKSTVIAENEGYGRGVDNSLRFNDRSQESPDEDEYSYAYNNAVQFVKTHKQELESHTNHHELGSSVVNCIYDQTDELNQMACEAPVHSTLEDAVYAKVDKSKKKYPSNPADAPIYNTLEEPEYAKVDKSLKAKLSAENKEGPLYNVFEGPEIDEKLSDGPRAPSYQVLEGPFSEGPPVYDVLEGPESDDAPVHGALEGQDPHVYGALDTEENRGYDDMVYDAVGDVINDQGDIYQELNQSGQRNSDIYQALNYPENTMHLNELDQTHSNA